MGTPPLKIHLPVKNVIPKLQLCNHILSTKNMKFQTTSDDQTNTMKTFAKEAGSIIKRIPPLKVEPACARGNSIKKWNPDFCFFMELWKAKFT